MKYIGNLFFIIISIFMLYGCKKYPAKADLIFSKYSSLSLKEKFADAVIVCDGNSLTYGHMSSNPATKSYPFRLKFIYPFNVSGTTVINKGIDAQTTEDMISDAGTDIDLLFNPKVRSVLIAWEIGNDIYFNGSEPNAERNFKDYCIYRQEAGWRVIVMSLPFRSLNGANTPFGDTDAQYDIKRQRANTWLRANWKSFADGFCDLALNVNFSAYNTTYYQPDHTHFTDAGYQLVADMVSSRIKNLTD